VSNGKKTFSHISEAKPLIENPQGRMAHVEGIQGTIEATVSEPVPR